MWSCFWALPAPHASVLSRVWETGQDGEKQELLMSAEALAPARLNSDR